MPSAAIAPADFEYVRQFVRVEAAIALEPNKAYLVESRLTPLMRQLALPSLGALVAQLRAQPPGELHGQVIEALTTNETSFFRDQHPFDALRTEILPALIERRRTVRSLSIWSAGSSSGQEPYSLAMLLKDHFPELASWRVAILATDISDRVLKRAEQACYSQAEVNRGLSAPLLVKHFQQAGLQWQLKPAIRRMVQFQKLNLIAPWPQLPAMDLILIRNVLMYFTPETKKQVLRKVRNVLSPDSALLLGGAETTLGMDDCFERVNHGKSSSYRLTRGP